MRSLSCWPHCLVGWTDSKPASASSCPTIWSCAGRWLPINSRVSDHSISISNHQGRLNALTQDIQNARAKQLEHEAVVDSRFKPLEEAAARRLIIEVRQPNAAPVIHDEGVYHHKFPLLLRLATHLSGSRRNIWLAGPAGSGKTTAAHQVADKLGLPFDSHGAIRTPFQVTGHYDIHGTYRSSQFRRIFENGGVILLDEIDASDPGAVLELNQALSNSKMSFPDATIDRHPDCIVIASANTWGFGGDANYVARYKADAASLDRFVTVSWDYDPNFERPGQQRRVVFHRAAGPAAAEQQEAKIVISPRATLNGCELINSGAFTPEEIVEVVFGRYRQIDDWPTIGRAAEDFARRGPTLRQYRHASTCPTSTHHKRNHSPWYSRLQPRSRVQRRQTVTLMQKHFTSPREYARWLRTHPTGLGDHLVGVGKLPSYAYYGGAEAKMKHPRPARRRLAGQGQREARTRSPQAAQQTDAPGRDTDEGLAARRSRVLPRRTYCTGRRP
jgi:hypothetical protein